MKVHELMTPKPRTVSPDATLGDALNLMKRYGVHALPVIEDDELVGILTDRDLKMALGPDSRTLDLNAVDPRTLDGSVSWFMTEGVATVDRDQDLGKAAQTLLDLRVGALPVIDRRGDLVGILSVTDLVRLAVRLLEG